MVEELDRIEESRIRKSPQCLAILKELRKRSDHPTALDIHEEIKKVFPNLSLATVYNNLKKLTEHGFIQEVSVKNESNRFDGNPKTHYHMICIDCGEVNDLDYPLFHEIELFVSQLHNFIVSEHELNLYGVCKYCQQ